MIDVEILLGLLGLVAMVVGFIAEQRRERLDMQEITHLRVDLAMLGRAVEHLERRMEKLETTEEVIEEEVPE